MTPVLFDLDGTLIDSLPSITDAANAVLSEQNLPPIGQDKTVGFVGRGERVFVERMIAATDLDPDAFDALLARFVEHYKVSAASVRLMPGARDAVDVLRDVGYPLGLVTNKPRAPLGPTIDAAGLADAFDIVLAGDDLERRKPDPLPLAVAMERLGGETCLYVGDSDVDAETAKNAGVPFALYTEGIRTMPVESLPHDAAFDDFRDLPGIVRKLIG